MKLFASIASITILQGAVMGQGLPDFYLEDSVISISDKDTTLITNYENPVGHISNIKTLTKVNKEFRDRSRMNSNEYPVAISRCNREGVLLREFGSRFSIRECRFGSLDYFGATNPRKELSIWLENDTINSLNIQDANLHELQLDPSSFLEYVKLTDCTVRKPLHLKFNVRPQLLDLSRLTFDTDASITVSFKYDTATFISALFMQNSDIDKINIKYNGFQLHVEEEDFDEAKRIYEKLKSKYAQLGMMDSYENLDKDYRSFLHYQNFGIFANITDPIDRLWWDYGYKKQLVVRGSLVLFLIFFFINSFFYGFLLDRGYMLEQFIEIERERKYPAHSLARYITRLPNVFLYTGFIFWGFKLEKDNINIRSGWLYYIVFQYLIGLVCVAYIANLIITR